MSRHAIAICSVLAVNAAAPAFAQSLTIGVRGGPESIDPAFSTLGTHAEALKNIYDPLVWQDEKLQLKPWLAESWSRINDTTWEFKLKKSVKCHDGTDFTAEDVKFTIERIPGATGPQPTTSYIKNVKAMKIPEPHTLHIETPAPSGILPYEFNRLSIVCKGAGDAKSPEMNAGKGAIGTGPFKFVSWAPKGDLVMDRFDDYWGGKAPWQRHVRREISNDAARVAALLAGQVDMINYVPNQDYATLAKNNRVTVQKADSIYVFQLYLDLREASPMVSDAAGNKLAKNPLANPRVREAIDLAIDRQAIADTVLEGVGIPATNTMAPGLFGEKQDRPKRAFNPDQAKKLLAEAGFPQGFKLTIYCTNDRLPGDSAVCQALAQMLTQAGIQTTPTAISRTILFPAWNRLEYSAVMAGWGSLTGEAYFTLSLMYHTAQPTKSLGGFNRQAYSNPEVDRLTGAGSMEPDDMKRRALFEQALEVAHADRVTLPITVLQSIWASKANAFEFTPRADEETLAFFVRPKK